MDAAESAEQELVEQELAQQELAKHDLAQQELANDDSAIDDSAIDDLAIDDIAPHHLAPFCWPLSRLGECVAALARKTGLIKTQIQLPNEASIEWLAKRLSCEAEAIETTFAELENSLSAAHPALLKLGNAGFLAIVSGNRRTLRLLTPNFTISRVPLKEVCNALRAAVDQPTRPDYETLLSATELSLTRQAEVLALLLAEQIGARSCEGCWLLRVAPGAKAGRWMRQSGTLRKAGGLIAAYAVQYLLLIASWAVLGRLSFRGRLDHSWLLLWALLLLTLVPFLVLTTWLQGQLVVGFGGMLKRRLLAGALRLEPDEIRHQGVGTFLGQALEAEAVETLALSGGIAGLLSLIEILVSAFVLGRFAILLLIWTALTAVVAWRFLRRYQRWTSSRMAVTQDLIESMVGHRTRLAQQRREEWHEAEDQALQGYFTVSRAADAAATSLTALIPRGWLLVGLAALAPQVVQGQAQGETSAARIAVLLGGVLLAYNAFRRLTASSSDIAVAWVAWQRVAPLFHAASRPENLAPAPDVEDSGGASENVIEADALTYAYRKGVPPVLKAGNLTIRRGERVLLEGSSGGGKSTFASLLSGLRTPDSGRLLLNGFDRRTLGDDNWRKRVVTAPQFHENHILTETLAFNVLMGRGWPPTQRDAEEAESMCRELGLGDLLERMPAGIMQMVGEGGWQLSHGERSRIYVARALLQKADLIILDESFAALDPENLKTALECTLRHAQTLLVIAHP